MPVASILPLVPSAVKSALRLKLAASNLSVVSPANVSSAPNFSGSEGVSAVFFVAVPKVTLASSPNTTGAPTSRTKFGVVPVVDGVSAFTLSAMVVAMLRPR